MAYSRAGEERQDFRTKVGTLGKNQTWEIPQPDAEERTGAGNEGVIMGHVVELRLEKRV